MKRYASRKMRRTLILERTQGSQLLLNRCLRGGDLLTDESDVTRLTQKKKIGCYKKEGKEENKRLA